MLKQRVITALILLALLLPALFASSAWPFAILTLLMIGAAGWEWARLNAAGGSLAVVFGLVLAAACAAALAVGWGSHAPVWAWWLAALVWVPGGAYAMRAGPAFWPTLPSGLRLVLGWLGLFVGWLALANAKVAGVNFLLSAMCLVWAADIAAYFGGRAFGRRKLSPAISPGKSWEGVWSGMAGVLALAVLWIFLDRRFELGSPSLYSHLAERMGYAGLALALLFLSAMSVVGDLVESLVKRSAGAKDSSQLLPGHGGVLDRIDALLPVMPLAMALSWY
jgi:phosphatidate cytidylyltransferase